MENRSDVPGDMLRSHTYGRHRCRNTDEKPQERKKLRNDSDLEEKKRKQNYRTDGNKNSHLSTTWFSHVGMGFFSLESSWSDLEVECGIDFRRETNEDGGLQNVSAICHSKATYPRCVFFLCKRNRESVRRVKRIILRV